jgi:drug/metabolite transporter (DMT)-like permease
VLTTLFWSGNMVIGRAIRDQVPPLSLAFWRWAIALALVLPLALPHLRAQWPLLRAAGSRRHSRSARCRRLQHAGLHCPAIHAGNQRRPAQLLHSDRHDHPVVDLPEEAPACCRDGFGVLLSFIGVTTIVCRGDVATLARLSLNVGDLWMLAAVFTWALYTIGLQWRPAGVHPMLLLAAFTMVGLLALAPAYAWEIAQGKTIHVSAGVLAGIAYTGVFPGFLGYVFYNRAVAEVGASKASLFIHLMPVFGTLLSAIFLEEVPQLYHYAGIALIFAGIYLTTTALPQAKTA